MRSLILVVLAVLGLPLWACACGGPVERVRNAVGRVVQRGTSMFSSPQYVVPQFVAPAPQNPPPKPMPSVNPVGNSDDLKAEIAELKRRQAAAGRALLFGDTVSATTAAQTPKVAAVKTTKTTVVYAFSARPYAYVAPTPRVFGAAVAAGRAQKYYPVAPVRRTLTTLGNLGACPGGQCPAR